MNEREFSDKLRILIGDMELRKTLAENGYRYTKTCLDWKFLAANYWNVLQDKLFRKREKRRLLVITHRFNDPPLGGAELYLLNVIKAIDQLGNFRIDIATTNIHSIQNKFHFSTEFTFSESSESSRFGNNIYVHRFALDRVSERTKFLNSKTLFSKWYGEFVDHSLKHVDKYNCPLLLGGWNFSEKSEDGTFRIWSSEKITDLRLWC